MCSQQNRFRISTAGKTGKKRENSIWNLYINDESLECALLSLTMKYFKYYVTKCIIIINNKGRICVNGSKDQESALSTIYEFSNC